MGPITYSLCKKPVIGLVMFITNLCAFPPLFENEPISLLHADTKVVKTFNVSVARKYFLDMIFRFRSAQERLDDQKIGAMVDRDCVEAESSTTALFKVTVKRNPSQLVVWQQIYCSIHEDAHTTTNRIETIGSMELEQGDYTLELINLRAHPSLDRVQTQLALKGHGK